MADIVALAPGMAAPARPTALPGTTLLADLDPAAALTWETPAGLLSPSECHDAAMLGLIERALHADPEGPEHARRVGLMAAELAGAMGVPPPARRQLQRAAELHDIGKLALPQAILGYRHVFDAHRRHVIEQHALFGAAMLSGAREPWMRLARSIALCHHERWDGSGYPAGLVQGAIPLAARVTAVADVYDALRSVRVYKAAMTHEDAMLRLLEGDERIRPGHFDPACLRALYDVADAFAAIHDEVPDIARRRSA